MLHIALEYTCCADILTADEGGFDAAEIDRDLIAQRLKEDVAEEKGKLYRHFSDNFAFNNAVPALFRMDSATTTGIAVCNPYVYTVTRDRYLIKWELPAYPPPPATKNNTPAKRPKRVRYVRGGRKGDESFEGHTDDILCVAASADGKLVVTGGKDHKLIVWDAEKMSILKVFKHHRAAVTGLVFRRGTNEVYSSSSDRTIKLWSMNELAYIETLFGHQDEVVGISALSGERCVTVGARDRTARLWKIVDETQLVFRGGGEGKVKRTENKDGSLRYEEGSMDVVSMIDEEHFVTGSDNGYFYRFLIYGRGKMLTMGIAEIFLCGRFIRKSQYTPSPTPTALRPRLPRRSRVPKQTLRNSLPALLSPVTLPPSLRFLTLI
jgi:ribosomal RNA-processing protein 9